MNKHIPVLLNESIAAFEPVAINGNTIVDCTLGGAGHTSALLEHYPDVKVLGCDMDASAIEAASERLNLDLKAKRVHFYNGNFSELVDLDANALPEGFAPPWHGALLDLGFSS